LLRTSRSRWTLGIASFAAAAIVAAVVLSSSGTSGPPAATRVAAVWTLPATSSAVTPNPNDHRELNVVFHGTPYPNYHDSEGWHPVGTRTDQIAGIPTLTVYYAVGKRRAAYTVLAGTRVSVPASATYFVADGVPMAEFRSGDRWVVVFRNHGNTCVLTAAAPREKQWLVKLAVWRSRATEPA
jgi:hypothetical protein